MGIDSPLYILFLVVLTVIFFRIPQGRGRLLLLLIASCGFYINFSITGALTLIYVALATYFISIHVAKNQDSLGSGIFAAMILLLLFPLLFYKYGGQLIGLAFGEEGGFGLAQATIPVGVSFFTFSALGYVIDVRLGVVPVENRFSRLALFLGYFPYVTAGPIGRAGSMLPQFDLGGHFIYQRSVDASKKILHGLVLKLFCANALSSPVNAIYGDILFYDSGQKFLCIIFSIFYVYADFLGYSLIALGSAQLMGVNVPVNFEQPFFSRTIPEFWKSWHISLSSWIRDYLFAPMQVSWRRHRWGTPVALLISFTILGIWHGGGWGPVVFGLTHGVLMIASSYTLNWRTRMHARLGTPVWLVSSGRVVITFFTVCLTFVIFRANDLPEAWVYLKSLLSAATFGQVVDAFSLIVDVSETQARLHPITAMSAGWGAIAFMIVGDIMARRKITLDRIPVVGQYLLYSSGVVLVVFGWIMADGGEPFFYYKF